MLNEEVDICSCSTNCRSISGDVYKKTANGIRGKVTLLFNGVPIFPKDLGTSFSTSEELSTIITAFDGLNYCEGITDPSLTKVTITDRISGKKDIFGRWRLNFCSFIAGVGKTGLCPKCHVLKKYLSKKANLQTSKPRLSQTMERKMERRYRKIEGLKRTVQVCILQDYYRSCLMLSFNCPLISE